MSTITSLTSPAAPTPSTPPPPSSQVPFPVPQSPTGTGGSGTSSTLYLYTFLATLVVLLAISGTIVFRSMVRRRRQRAAILEAIANGTYIPTVPVVLTTERPRMWEVYLDADKPYVRGTYPEQGSALAYIKPVSATILYDAEHPRPRITPPPRQPLLPLPAFLRRPRPAPPPILPAEPQTERPVPVQLAVLVAMPGGANEEQPVLEFGVEVVHGHVREPPSPSSLRSP